MKKMLCFLLMTMLVATACQPKPETVPVDLEAAKAAVIATMNKYHSSLMAKDVSTMVTLLADDGLFCGTDSKEFLDKSTLMDAMKNMVADTTLKMNYSIIKQEIRVFSDGISAIAIDQFVMDFISPKIPVRWIFHLVKTGDNWIIDFSSLSLIPDNKDLGKINGALE